MDEWEEAKRERDENKQQQQQQQQQEQELNRIDRQTDSRTRERRKPVLNGHLDDTTSLIDFTTTLRCLTLGYIHVSLSLSLSSF